MAGPWFYRSLATGTGDGLSWANARTSLATMTSVLQGDTIWVADDHAQSSATAITITLPGSPNALNMVVCVDHNVASPGPGDWKTTATITTTAGVNITINGSAYVYGLRFICGQGVATAAAIAIAAATGGIQQVYENCNFQVATTINSNAGNISVGINAVNAPGRVIFDNTTMRFAAVSQTMFIRQGFFEWRNTVAAVSTAGTVPTTLFTPANFAFMLTCEGVDFSMFTSSKTMIANNVAVIYRAIFHGCKFGGVLFPTTLNVPGCELILSHSGDAGSNTMMRTEKYAYEGNERTVTQIARTGGATFSRCYVMGSPLFIRPYVGLPLVKWNKTIDADLTITLYGMCFLSAIPYNDEIWFEVQYLGEHLQSPLVYIINATKLNNSSTGTLWTADTSTWDSQLPERANNHSYADGDFIKVASNPGRVFMAQGSGTTASSEPTEFAAAIDGEWVDDGTATFATLVRFRMTFTLNAPQPKGLGPIYVFPKFGSSTNQFWLDPEIG